VKLRGVRELLKLVIFENRAVKFYPDRIAVFVMLKRVKTAHPQISFPAHFLLSDKFETPIFLLRFLYPFGFQIQNFFENERNALPFPVPAPYLRQTFRPGAAFPQAAFVQIQKRRRAARRN